MPGVLLDVGECRARRCEVGGGHELEGVAGHADFVDEPSRRSHAEQELGRLEEWHLGHPRWGPDERLGVRRPQLLFDAELGVLRKVASLCKLEHSGLQIFDLLVSLVCTVLKLKDTDPKLLEILAIRTLRTTAKLSDLLAEEVVDQVLDEDDRRHIQQEEKRHESMKSAKEAYTVRLKALRSKVMSPTAAPNGGRRGQGGSSSSREALVVVPPPFPAGALAREQAQLLMPQGARIFRDTAGKRWHAFWVEGSNTKQHIVSRSYMVYGDRPACVFVLYQSWLTAELRGAEPSPHRQAFHEEVVAAGMA